MAARSAVRRGACGLLLSLALVLTACSATPTPTAPPPTVSTSGVTQLSLDLRDPSRTTPMADGRAAPGRDLPTTVWYPTADEGPLPVVVFSHGLASTPEGWEALLSAWAAAGFVVAAPRFPATAEGSAELVGDLVQQPADVAFVLDHVLALGSGTGELAGRIDTSHIAAAGHSAGAVTTLGLRSECCTDPRITASLLLAAALPDVALPELAEDPGSRFTNSPVPSLFVHGTADDTIPFTAGVDAFDEVRGPKAFISLPGGGHSRPYYDTGSPQFPVVRDATTAFLRWALKADEAALAQLRSTVDQTEVADLTVDELGP